ncbi:amino acid transporter [Billgrantia tianxiuensis]|jgi:L-lysine exporter family protein LysE/ArgO|uniref:Amino acid transporter n=1 Tax=Billgrantia tianxiuensis TaxID=2497861 RepID=A0A6I6SQ11_9GAMM|nr:MULTISPECIES: LysE family transporter [Halomonas]MCE8032040.1 LysE family transporter [Halomonas sp. MCCC 1A11057]QHC49920.1 amino acid transporter [Halomonas tianxiuensis]
MWLSWLNGLLICAGLIVAIGAQNAFVLQQSLRRQHAWMVAGVCALCDWLLVGLGVLGLGVLIAQQDALMEAARWAGAAFLAWQAWLAFRRVLAGQALAAGGGRVQSWQAALAATLAVTLLNPQVYLETVVLLGAIGAVQPSPLGFFIGAAMASFGWFFGLAAAAGWLAPRLANPRVWRAIDLAIGIILAWVAWRLASGAMMP